MPDTTPPFYAIRQQLTGATFPATKADLVKRFGDVKVGPQGEEVLLKDLFAKVAADKLADEDEAVRLAGEAFVQLRG